MTTFVFVHGAFGSPAELAPVIPELEALGHSAITVDLPCTDPAAILEEYAATVVDAADRFEPGHDRPYEDGVESARHRPTEVRVMARLRPHTVHVDVLLGTNPS